VFIHRPAVDSLILVEVPNSRVRYYPYGTDRPGSGNPATDYRFTGQRQEGTIGLYDYGARFYDPLLGRFLSADTVVPEPGNPQALNRYAYVLNNPLKYTDPTGHKYEGGYIPDEAREGQYEPPPPPPPLPPHLKSIEEFLTSVLPANVGASQKVLFEGPTFSGPGIRFKANAKVTQVVSTASRNARVYAESSRWRFDVPLGKGKAWYVQIQDDWRVGMGGRCDDAVFDDDGTQVTVRTASAASFPLPWDGMGGEMDGTISFMWDQSGLRQQVAFTFNVQLETNTWEILGAAGTAALLIYGAGLLRSPNPQPVFSTPR